MTLSLGNSKRVRKNRDKRNKNILRKTKNKQGRARRTGKRTKDATARALSLQRQRRWDGDAHT